MIQSITNIGIILYVIKYLLAYILVSDKELSKEVENLFQRLALKGFYACFKLQFKVINNESFLRKAAIWIHNICAIGALVIFLGLVLKSIFNETLVVPN